MDYRDRLSGIDHAYCTNKAQLFLVDMLFTKLRLKRKISILSIGCGDGNELKVLCKYGTVDILDINSDAVRLIPKNLYSSVFISNICQFQAEKRYDAIAAFEVLEHIKEDIYAIDKVYELLKPNGYFLYSVPMHQNLFSAHDKFLHHFRRYSKNRLKSLSNRKFETIFSSYRYFFSFLPILISKLIYKNTKPKIEAMKAPNFINELLLSLLKVEIFLMNKGISLPLGISSVGIWRKGKPDF